MANKSRLKVNIIQGIDKKLPLEEIAADNNLDMQKLIEEMSMIVTSGTKLDINYYIEENIDEYSHDDIMEYFEEAESESVDDAFEELKDEDITREEIEIVRIKFLSEVVN